MANITGKADASLIKADAGTYDTGGSARALQAGLQGFGAGIKPLFEAAQKFEADYQAWNEKQPELENLGNYSDFQLGMIDQEYGKISDEWSSLSRRLARNKDDIEAKNRLAQLTGQIKNLDAGQSALSNIRFNMSKDLQGTAGLSDFHTATEKEHMQIIQATLEGKSFPGKEAPTIAYVGDNSTLQITMADGTVYGGLGSSANQQYKPIPTPQHDYVEGNTALNNFATGLIQDGKTATAVLSPKQSKTRILNILNGSENVPGTKNKLSGSRAQNSTLFFKDLTPDDQDITYADAFASGQLSQEFYKDGTGAIIKASDETPAFNAKGEYQWTEEQAKEYLRNPIHYNHNVDNFAEYFGNATSELHNNEFRTKMAGNDRYLKTASGDFFGSVANVNAAKVNTYVDMLVDRDLVAGGSAVQKSIDNLRNSFRNSDVQIAKTGKNNKIGIQIGDNKGMFDLTNPSEIRALKIFLRRSDSYKQLNLGADPSQYVDFMGSPLTR